MKHVAPLLLLAPLACLGQGQKSSPARKPIAKTASQRQAPGLQGIGPFKLGSTRVEDMERLAQRRQSQLVAVADIEDRAMATDSAVVELKYTPNNNLPYAYSCPEVRLVRVRTYRVAGLDLTDTYLTFYQGVLRAIRTDYSDELQEAFTIKYGPPRLVTKVTKVPCVYRLTGRVVNYQKREQTNIWYNGSVKAIFYDGEAYDENCHQYTENSVVISDERFAAPMAACERAADQREKAAQRRKLGGL